MTAGLGAPLEGEATGRGIDDSGLCAACVQSGAQHDSHLGPCIRVVERGYPGDDFAVTCPWAVVEAKAVGGVPNVTTRHAEGNHAIVLAPRLGDS